MNFMTRYVKALDSIYKDDYINVVDLNNDMLYISKKLASLMHLQNINKIKPRAITSFKNQFYDKFLKEVLQHNSYVVTTGKNLNFIVLGDFFGTNAVTRGIKYPIFDEQDVICGVLTIFYPAQSIHLDRLNNVSKLNNNAITSKIKHHNNLSVIEELIIFYYSLGFKQSEVFEFIKAKHNELSLYSFKYYQSNLLKKFNIKGINELIEKTEELQSKRYLPKELIKNKFIVFR